MTDLLFWTGAALHPFFSGFDPSKHGNADLKVSVSWGTVGFRADLLSWTSCSLMVICSTTISFIIVTGWNWISWTTLNGAGGSGRECCDTTSVFPLKWNVYLTTAVKTIILPKKLGPCGSPSKYLQLRAADIWDFTGASPWNKRPRPPNTQKGRIL